MLGLVADIPRTSLFTGTTPIERMPNLSAHCGGAQLLVKRDDCTGLAFGGNKVRQLEFYLGAACLHDADTILITGAVQSNFVRLAAAAACKLGMDCHVQLEERVDKDDPDYRESGNVFIDRLLGATLHRYPDGEDEAGADRQLESIAAELQAAGKRPYIIHLGSRHPPLGLRALDSDIPVTGVCVRRSAQRQRSRIKNTCDGLAAMLQTDSKINNEDISLTDEFLAPGYGKPNEATLNAIVLAAQKEGLLVDPVYTGKVLAAVIHEASTAKKASTFLFLHTGGSPALFAYRKAIEGFSLISI